MPSLLHTLKTKGFANTIKRVAMIYSRYSFNGLMRSLNKMLEILEDYNAGVTFPITAVTLDRNMDLIKEVNSSKIEWAMHGYVHIDYTTINLEEIEKHIKKGKEIFKKAGFEVYGFRAPYLKINEDTIKMLKKYGFIYDSSHSFFLPVIPIEKSVKIILDYYSPLKEWKIDDTHGLLEIPVTLPDDEILVDRLGYRGDKIGKVWVNMCEKLKETNIIPVLQLHPERGRICAAGLKMVLEWARKNDIEIVHLKDIAMGKRENVMAITGDVDVIKPWDWRYMSVSEK